MISAMHESRRWLLALVAACIFTATDVAAEPSNMLGTGRLFTNDFLGDGQDRWRTGSYVISKIFGNNDTGGIPANAGDLLELRFRSEIISPANTVSPKPSDRRYVGAISIGLHTHFMKAGWETSLGLDLVATGPSTPVDDFHKVIHDLLNQPVDAATINQIPDGLHPTVLAEMGRIMTLSDTVAVRPFIEAQAGVETFARVGMDITLGELNDQCHASLRIRDVVTGHRYRAMPCDSRGPTLVLGMDTAQVFDSRYLPSEQGYELTNRRTRVRAGVEFRGKRSHIFYGLTYLGKEFESQGEGQVVGSVNIGLNF